LTDLLQPGKAVKRDGADKSGEPTTLDSDAALAAAFETFTLTTQKLQRAYEILQAKYEEVNRQLEEKNKELQESLWEISRIRNYLNNILESMPSGLLVVNLKGEIITFNRAAEEITGYSAEDIIGRPYRILCRETKPGDPLQLIAGDRNRASYEWRLRRADGRFIPVGSNTSLVRDERGEVIGAMEIFSDLSEVKRLEKEVQQARTLAVLGQMASTVAHEIRNPLGGIEGFATLLARDFNVDDPKRKLVNRIVDGVKSLNNIVSNLLEFTRPLPARYREYNLVEIVDSAIAYIDGESQSKGRPLKIIREYGREKRMVRCDRGQLSQVFLNILGNAVQAMAGEGEIRVGIKYLAPEEAEDRSDLAGVEGRGLYRVYFADSGPGISVEPVEKIFNPFFTTREKGTGLGLAIAQKIVEAHGGKITALNLSPRGAEFRVDLPLPGY